MLIMLLLLFIYYYLLLLLHYTLSHPTCSVDLVRFYRDRPLTKHVRLCCYLLSMIVPCTFSVILFIYTFSIYSPLMPQKSKKHIYYITMMCFYFLSNCPTFFGPNGLGSQYRMFIGITRRVRCASRSYFQ